MAAISTFLDNFSSGQLPPFQTHAVLLGGAIAAEILVAIGILLESPKEKTFREWFGLVFVFGGVVISATFTIGLFVFDEGISTAQQTRITALVNENSAIRKAMAFRIIAPGRTNGRIEMEMPIPEMEFERALGDISGIPVEIQSIPDFEAERLAADMVFLLNGSLVKRELEKAPWNAAIIDASSPLMKAVDIDVGVSIWAPEDPRLQNAATVLEKALLAAGITDARISPWPLSGNLQGTLPHPNFSGPLTFLYVTIGPRPAPVDLLK